MGSSYKEDCEEYKNAKFNPELGEHDAPHRKGSKRKRPKRADHKHEYAKALFHCNNGWAGYSVGEYCKVCGRVNNQTFFHNEATLVLLLDSLPVIEINDWRPKYVSVS